MRCDAELLPAWCCPPKPWLDASSALALAYDVGTDEAIVRSPLCHSLDCQRGMWRERAEKLRSETQDLRDLLSALDQPKTDDVIHELLEQAGGRGRCATSRVWGDVQYGWVCVAVCRISIRSSCHETRSRSRRRGASGDDDRRKHRGIARRAFGDDRPLVVPTPVKHALLPSLRCHARFQSCRTRYPQPSRNRLIGWLRSAASGGALARSRA